jgi:hypothetical protein
VENREAWEQALSVAVEWALQAGNTIQSRYERGVFEVFVSTSHVVYTGKSGDSFTVALCDAYKEFILSGGEG